jgi:hypothetical protein
VEVRQRVPSTVDQSQFRECDLKGDRRPELAPAVASFVTTQLRPPVPVRDVYVLDETDGDAMEKFISRTTYAIGIDLRSIRGKVYIRRGRSTDIYCADVSLEGDIVITLDHYSGL